MDKLNVIKLSVLVVSLLLISSVSAQVTTSCTASLITSFMPCLNYVTGSANSSSGSPTSDCCQALSSLISSSTGCACLILSGGVPFSIPINRTLAVSLPQMCNTKSLPLQCGLGAQGPSAAGTPLGLAPALAPIPSLTPSLPPSSTSSSSQPLAPSPESGNNPNNGGGQRPVVVPSSAMKFMISSNKVMYFLMLVFGSMMLN